MRGAIDSTSISPRQRYGQMRESKGMAARGEDFVHANDSILPAFGRSAERITTIVSLFSGKYRVVICAKKEPDAEVASLLASYLVSKYNTLE